MSANNPVRTALEARWRKALDQSKLSDPGAT